MQGYIKGEFQPLMKKFAMLKILDECCTCKDIYHKVVKEENFYKLMQLMHDLPSEELLEWCKFRDSNGGELLAFSSPFHCKKSNGILLSFVPENWCDRVGKVCTKKKGKGINDCSGIELRLCKMGR